MSLRSSASHVSTLKGGEIHTGLDKCNPGSLLVFLEFVGIDIFNLVTVYNVSLIYNSIVFRYRSCRISRGKGLNV